MALNLGTLAGVLALDDSKFNTTLDGAQRNLEGAKGGFGTAALAVGAAAGAALAVGFGEALDLEAANAKLSAQLDLTPAESERVGGIAGDLYANAYGENLDQVNEAIRSVILNIDGMADASDADLQAVTAAALDLSKAFGTDVGETARAAGKLIKTGLADNATEAMDLLTKGFQTGADEAGDLLDTVSEYSTKFRDLGLEGPAALGLISQGLQAGARDADTVADALKEFSIRAIDGSTATAEGFAAVGLNAEDMAAKIAGGGQGAADALDQTLDSLRNIEDPVERNAAAVALFGTKAEDLGDALFALDPSEASAALGDVGDAAANMGDTLNDTAQNDVESWKRTTEGWLASLVTIPGPIGDITGAVGGIGATVGPALGNIGMLAAGFGGFGSIASTVVSGFKSIGTAVGVLGKAFMANPWMLAIAGLILVVTLVITYWDEIIAALEVAWTWIVDTAASVWNGIVDFFTGIGEAIWGAVTAAWNWIVDFFVEYWPFILGIFTGGIGLLVGLVVDNWDSIVAWTTSTWSSIVEFLGGIWDAIVAGVLWFVDLFLSYYEFLASIPIKAAKWFGGLLSSALDKFTSLVSWAKGVPGRVLDALGNVGSKLVSAGKDLISGLLNGMKSMASNVLDWIGGLLSDMGDAVLDYFGIASPSKLTTYYGEMIGAGLARGLHSAAGLVGRASDALNGAVALPEGDDLSISGDGSMTVRFSDEDRQLLRGAIEAGVHIDSLQMHAADNRFNRYDLQNQIAMQVS